MSSPSEEAEYGDPFFLKLQRQAPKPVPVEFQGAELEDRPPHYGPELHGAITREEGELLVRRAGQGAFLIRESLRQPGQFTLMLLFDDQVRNYRIYFDGSHHFVHDKYYDSLLDLVADGLINLYCEKYGRDRIRTMTMTRRRRRSRSSNLYSTQDKGFRRPPLAALRPVSSVPVESSEEGALSNSTGALYENTTNLSLDLSMSTTSGSVRLAHPSVTGASSLTELPSPGDDADDSPVSKAHRFKVTTFFGPHWCAVCTNYMWGLVQQGERCEDCGLPVHKQCVQNAAHSCVPTKKRVKFIFGTDLTVLCLAYNCSVPFVVSKCIEQVEAREGHFMEGIYRIGTYLPYIETVRQQFEDQAEHARIDTLFFPDTHSISCTLKNYLRSLPIPVIHYDLYQPLLALFDASSDTHCEDGGGGQLASRVAQLLREMNVYHQRTLKLIVKHLVKVASFSYANKMTPSNLATVFAPCLLRNIEESLQSVVRDTTLQMAVVCYLIENYQTIWS